MIPFIKDLPGIFSGFEDFSENRGIVFDIKKFAIHDGPGIRTTVFLKGCPLRCLICHNPEGQAFERELMFRSGKCILCGDCVRACPNNALLIKNGALIYSPGLCNSCGLCTEACSSLGIEFTGREVTVNNIMEVIERDTIFYDESRGGVTFSGGEPLAQPRFLYGLLSACKAKEIHTVVDTSGFASSEIFQTIQGTTDLFLFDLKIMDKKKHIEFTGVSNELILENMRWLSASRSTFIVRFPLVPGFNDNDGEIRKIAEFLLSLENLPVVDIMPYHFIGVQKYERLKRPYEFSGRMVPSEESVRDVAGLLCDLGLRVLVKGEPL